MIAIKRATITIDATGKSLGRLATTIARLLQGKHKATYVSHRDEGDIVEVLNIIKMVVTGKKLTDKMYFHYSGYPGGTKQRMLRDVLKEGKGGGWILKKAVYKMLPKNRQRNARIKRLVIS